MNYYLHSYIHIFFAVTIKQSLNISGLELAKEIQDADKNNVQIKFWKEAVKDEVWQKRIKQIREEVENFAVNFRMPGNSDIWANFKQAWFLF